MFPQEESLQENYISFENGYQLEIASGLGMGSMCPLLFSALEPHLVQTCAQGDKPANHSKANVHSEVTETVTA